MSEELPPLVVEFDVAADPSVAFAAWVGRAATWWPRGHTISGSPRAVVFEPHVGGRIFERDAAGGEHDWGEVLAWEPPSRLGFLWHLFFTRQEATHVEVSFTPVAGGTRVRLVQAGWEAHGDTGSARRERTGAGWAAVTAPYRAQFGQQ